MTHGTRHLTPAMFAGSVPGWSADFDAWAADALARADIDELAAYQDHAPGMPYAHPTPDHYIPVFVTLGAATNFAHPITTVIDGYMIGLSRRSFQIG